MEKHKVTLIAWIATDDLLRWRTLLIDRMYHCSRICGPILLLLILSCVDSGSLMLFRTTGFMP